MAEPVKKSTPTTKPPEDAIGDRIRAARERQGLSQSQLHLRTKEADSEGKGVARTVLIGYESGKFKPGARELRVLCTALSLSPQWLLLGQTDTPSARSVEEDFEVVRARLLAGFGDPDLAEVFRLALVLVTLKAHERESLGTLIYGLASARKGGAATDALLNLADAMAADAELRLVELTQSFEAADNLRFFKGKKVFEHFFNLYMKAYEVKFGRGRK